VHHPVNGARKMKINWKQFAIALGLFLLGYFTFNSGLLG
jgi:hypothetical protein